MSAQTKQISQYIKKLAFSLVFFATTFALFAQSVTVGVTGPTTCALANTLIPYTVTVNFTSTDLNIVPAQDFCACSYVILSTLDNNNVAMGDIFINGVNRGPKVFLTEVGCEINPDEKTGIGSGLSEVTSLQLPGSSRTRWIYGISVRWNTPQCNANAGILKAEYKCESFNGAATITTELFPRKPIMSLEPINCASVKLMMTAAGTVNCGLGSTVGFDVEESTNGGGTWTVIFTSLSGVPRQQTYSPNNPASSKTLRSRMYTLIGGVKTYSCYSNIIYANIDNRPTTVSGPTYFSYGNHTAFYSINGSSPNNIFSFGGTGGGVNVSFLTPTNSSSVMVNVPATNTGGYFTVEAKGTAACGSAYQISTGVYVAGPNGFTSNPKQGVEDRADSDVEQEEVKVICFDGKLDITTGNTEEKTLSVIGIDGKILLHRTFSSETLSVELNNDFKSGVYVVNLVNKGKLTNKKIVINN